MQHHPGSWYIPWGVPLQKMLTVPFNTAAGYHQPQIATAAVAQPQPGGHQPQPQTYHHQPHHPQLLASNGAALQYQPMHPAASAMFTPLTLRNLVGHPHLHNLQQQQQPLIGATHQQPPPQQTAATLPGAPQQQSQLTALNINGVSVMPVRQPQHTNITSGSLMMPMKKVNCMISFFFFCFFFTCFVSFPFFARCGF